jgi:hypothetical protein
MFDPLKGAVPTGLVALRHAMKVIFRLAVLTKMFKEVDANDPARNYHRLLRGNQGDGYVI